MVVADDTVYRDDAGSEVEETQYTAPQWFTGAVRLKSITTSLPVVTTGQNGSGSPGTLTTVYDQYGRTIWTKDAGGYISYTAYDNPTGAVTETIRDVDTSIGDYNTSTLPAGGTPPAA